MATEHWTEKDRRQPQESWDEYFLRSLYTAAKRIVLPTVLTAPRIENPQMSTVENACKFTEGAILMLAVAGLANPAFGAAAVAMYIGEKWVALAAQHFDAIQHRNQRS